MSWSLWRRVALIAAVALMPGLAAAQPSDAVTMIQGTFGLWTCGSGVTCNPATHQISASGSGAVRPATIPWSSSAAVTADTYDIVLDTPAAGSISKLVYVTSGTGSPSFVISPQIDGNPITTCTAITVNSSTKSSTTCTGSSAAFTAGQRITLVVSSITGVPKPATVQFNFVWGG